MAVGNAIGVAAHNEVGMIFGDVVGVAVGFAFGIAVGMAVGDTDGTTVGMALNLVTPSHPKSTIYSILHGPKSCKIKFGLWLALQLVWRHP